MEAGGERLVGRSTGEGLEFSQFQREYHKHSYQDWKPLIFHDTSFFSLLILLIHINKFNVHNISITLLLKLALLSASQPVTRGLRGVGMRTDTRQERQGTRGRVAAAGPPAMKTWPQAAATKTWAPSTAYAGWSCSCRRGAGMTG